MIFIDNVKDILFDSITPPSFEDNSQIKIPSVMLTESLGAKLIKKYFTGNRKGK